MTSTACQPGDVVTFTGNDARHATVKGTVARVTATRVQVAFTTSAGAARTVWRSHGTVSRS